MRIGGSETERNLKTALADELYISFRYRDMAQAAKEAGQPELADIYLATAENEMEHAVHTFRFLEGVKGVKANLETAIQREQEEAERVYPRQPLLLKERDSSILPSSSADCLVLKPITHRFSLKFAKSWKVVKK